MPEEIEIPVGLIHIYKDDSKVYIRKQNTIPIGYRLLRSRVAEDLPSRRINIGRGRARRRFAQQTRTLSPTTRFPSNRGGTGNPLRFWTSNDASLRFSVLKT